NRPALNDSARNQLRQAIESLDALERQVGEMLRRQYRTTRRQSAELNATELVALRYQIQYYRGRAHLEQALAYPAGSADRTAALTLALERLRPLVQMQSKDVLYWQSLLAEVACLRVQGRLEEAQGRLAAAGAADVPDELRGPREAELMRLAAARNAWADA